MPYNTNDRLEREASESLVASELSAKMKQWREQAPPPKGRGSGASPFLILLVLFILVGVAWMFWPKTGGETPVHQEQPSGLPAPQQSPPQPAPPIQEPIAQKSTPTANRYLALARSNYRAPDFVSQIRGDAASSEDLLNDARRALAARQYAEALNALQNVSEAYTSDAAYLRGHALFGLRKYAQAAEVFGELTGSVRYGEAAQWYEVLALLPDFEHARPLILKKLKKMAAEAEHTFQSEATQLYRLL